MFGNFADGKDPSTLAYSVNVIQQADSDGFGPGYLLNGLTSTHLWFQVGIEYGWNDQLGWGVLTSMLVPPGSISTVPMIGNECADLSEGPDCYLGMETPLPSLSGQVHNGDKVDLKMTIVDNNEVSLSVVDTNTGASYSNTINIANLMEQSGFTPVSAGTYFDTSPTAAAMAAPSGLLTEWWQPNLPSTLGNEIIYTPEGYVPQTASSSTDLFSSSSGSTAGSTLIDSGFAGPASVAPNLKLTVQIAGMPANSIFFPNGEFITSYEPISVTLSPTSCTIIQGNSITFIPNINGGSPPFTFTYNANPDNGISISGNTLTFADNGLYNVYVNVKDLSGGSYNSPTSLITVENSQTSQPTNTISSSSTTTAFQTPETPLYWGCSTSSGCQPPSNTQFWQPCAYYASALILNATGITVNPNAILQQWQIAENNYGKVLNNNFGECNPAGVLPSSVANFGIKIPAGIGESYSNAAQFVQAYNGYVVTQDLRPFIKNFPQCIDYKVGTYNYNAIYSAADLASVLEFGNYNVQSDSGSYTGAFYSSANGGSGIQNAWYRLACGTCAADALGISCPPSTNPINTTVTSYPVQTSYTNGQGEQLETQNTQPAQGPAYSLSSILSGAPSNVPITASIEQYNNQSAAWLLTCPKSPDITNTQLFFTTSNSAFTAGDACMSNNNQLKSNVYDRVFFYGNGGLNGQAANAFAMVSVGNAAQGLINNTGYSGEVQQQGSNTFAIGNGQNSKSYIFNNVPSGQQQGIWTWSARYADLSSLNNPNSTPAKRLTIGAPTLEQTFTRIDPNPANPSVPFVTSWICKYEYNFTAYSNLTYVQNTNVIIPSQPLKSTSGISSSLQISGQIFPGFTQSSQYASPGGPLSCAGAMYYGTLQNVASCNKPNTWSRLVPLGVLTYGGKVQRNTYLYVNEKNPPINGILGSTSASTLQIWAAYPVSNGQYAEGYVTVYGSGNNNNPSSNTVTPILPFFLYNSSVPVSSSDTTWATAYVNSSYDLYSPQNFLSPNTSMDPISINTGSAFFGTEKGTLSMYPISLFSLSNRTNQSLLANENVFPLALNSSSLESDVGSSSLSAFNNKMGGYRIGTIYNPVYVGVAPNNYVYVVNLSSQSSWFSFSKSTQAYLFALKFVQPGDYNLSGASPSTVPASSTYQAWNTSWLNFWQGTSDVQNYNIYGTLAYQLTNTHSKFWGLEQSATGEPKINDFVAVSVASDSFGDVYILGHPTSTFWTRTFGTVPTELALINTVNNRVDVASIPGVPSEYATSQEFTVSPDGKTIYLATPQSGNILVYGVTYTTNPSTGALALNVYPDSQIDLSYSTPSYSLSIGSYLANGGPYNDSLLASDFSDSAGAMNDLNTYHHPLSIFDYKGALYVLDDWNLTTTSAEGSVLCPIQGNPIYTPTNPPSTCDVSGVDWMNILMLRAFYINNTEVPINPAAKMDLVPPPGASGSASQSAFVANIPELFPPYGWPISANISVNYANDQYRSYCVSGCTVTPSNIGTANTPYMPIGSEINLDSPGLLGNNVGTAMDLNGTFYMVAHTSNKFKVPYTELLATNLDFLNYTNIGFGNSNQYICYINVTSSDTPCDQLYSNKNYWSALTYLRPPIAAAPSAFEYAENTGYYRNFLTIAEDYYSTLPSGPNANGITSGGLSATSTNAEVSSAFNSVVIGAIPTINSIATTQSLQPPTTLAVNLGFTYLNSSITGYVAVPYTANYVITQTWDQDPLKGTFVSFIPTLDPNPAITPTTACNSITYYLPHNGAPGVITLIPDEYTSPSIAKNTPPAQPFCKVMSMTYDSNSGNSTAVEQCTIYTAAQAYLLSKHDPNATIEGGGTYATFLNGSFWEPSISDAATIMPPALQLQLFTNRLFGEIYVNRSVYNANVFSPPKVINASHSMDYLPLFVAQGAGLLGAVSAPGYAMEKVLYMANNSSVYGLQNGFKTLTGYYNPAHTDTLINNFSTSEANASVLAPPLFGEYAAATYLGTLDLQFMSGAVLGYNRLVTTYVDRFNNTIFMPMSLDLANTTTINMNLGTSISATNANQTVVTVSGTAGYVRQLNSTGVPLPQGSNIYLYYDSNLNYYTTSKSATPGTQGYWQYGEWCAFATNSIGQCTPADPLSTVTQQNEPNIAGTISYHPQYSSSGSCAPPPNSLLAVANTMPNCNIFGSFGLPETSNLQSNPGEYEYCVPTQQDGNGILTSQLGLIGIVNVQQNGQFNTSFTACGAGQATIIAQYYGWPPPEPSTVQQPSLQDSVSALANPKDKNINTLEFVYTNSPAQASGSVNIGNYVLSFGTIGIVGIVGIVAVIAVLVLAAAWPAKRNADKAGPKAGEGSTSKHNGGGK
jgi:hypothetical protein